MNSHYETRIRIISVAILLFGLILVGKLYFIQIVNNDLYTQKADRQYQSSSGNIFTRGNIYFQSKTGTLISAATLQSGFTVAINPQILRNHESVYEKLNTILPVDKNVFMIKAAKNHDPYEEIVTRVDTEIGKQISSLKIPGLSVYKDRWRFYPGGEIAAQTIGILGYKGDEYAGRYGLERQYENVLKRSDEAYVNFFAQIFTNLGAQNTTSSTQEGDIVTTIEPTVQSALEQVIASTTEKWNAGYVGAIIMDPKTGDIFAMANYPTFNPNNTGKEKNALIFSNPLVENVYEMGSILKPLTLAAGIDAGVITASSTYYDGGSITLSGEKIKNFDNKVRGVVSMQDFLSQSLNVGAVHIESLLGKQRFTDYMRKFGVDGKTGIDLPNEGRNLTQNLNSPRELEYAQIAFGQGIALTPITTVRALASIANDGVLVTPHVVKRINFKTGLFDTISYPTGTQVIQKSTAHEVARMMTYSVDNVLMNGTMKIPNYSVAVKTGTAQVAKEGGGGYSDSRILHSFVGFFPSKNPQFFIFLYMIDPKGGKFSSDTLTPPFMELVKFLINYYEVPPDR